MEEQKQRDDLPVILIHSISAFSASQFVFELRNRLQIHFQLIFPHDSPDPPHATISRHAQSIRALVCVGPAPVTSEFLGSLPCLELLVGSSAGLDNIDLKECSRRGIKVTNASPAFCEDVADCAVGLLIDVLRRISAADRFVKGGLWPVKKEYPLGSKVGSKRIGIVGLGNIGLEVAKRLTAFGCSIAYNSRNKKPSTPYLYYPHVRDLASNSDVLIVCCALTKETRHIVNSDVMSVLGKNGVVINIGRGALIDEKELVRFLVHGQLGGAGLDVFENEPNVPKELFALENVVLSPHQAVFTPESFEAVFELILGNLLAYFSNKPLLSLVQIE